MEIERVLDVLRAFDREQVEYVLVGGVALALHGLVRATQGVDLFVNPTPDHVERAKAALRSVFADPTIDQIERGDLAGAYPTVRYVPESEAFVIGLIGRLGDAVRYEDLEVEEREVSGVRVRLATPRTLYRMKRDTVRPIDRADADALRRRFDLREEP
jgi:hypothetical protein